MERGAGDRGKTAKYVKTLAKTLRGPRQMPITKKAKRRNYGCVCIHARHKMPSVTIFGDGVGPAAHEERAVCTSTYDLQRCQQKRE